MTKIFISYRRQDTKQISRRIFDWLEAKFGRDQVFMDIDSIPFGADFHAFLSEQVGRAETVLALIEHGWADARDEHGDRRLDNRDDFVRIEIEAALAHKILIVPIMIDGAPIPRAEQLPETMRALTRRNVAFLDSGRDFNTHMSGLIDDLERHLNSGFAADPPSRQTARKQSAEDRYRAEGRIEIDAPFITSRHGRWLLPGAGNTEWFKDLEHSPEMLVIPAGEFLMGSPETEIAELVEETDSNWYKNESPQHQVTISEPFAVGRFPVTFDEWDCAQDDPDWQSVTGLAPRRPHDQGWGRGSRPVIYVNWDDAQAYMTWLTAKTGWTYRLPSEAEREYVCRAGTQTPFWGGSSISTDQANYNISGKTLPVKSFAPNPWGLYQVHGNVWEWCADDLRPYSPEPIADPFGSLESARRALRGGAWISRARGVRSAFRLALDCDNRCSDFGFRCTRVLAQRAFK